MTAGPHPDGADPAPHDARALAELVGLDPPEYRREDMERLVGIGHEDMVRWWRAMGFAEVPEDEVAFGDADVEMARRLVALVGSDLLEDQDVLRLARLLGASFSRIAEAQAGVLDDVLDALPPPDGSATPWERIHALEQDPDTSLLAVLEDSIVYVWRRHLVAALGRWLGATGDDVQDSAVGFADISGFSKMSRKSSAVDLADVVDSFEATAFDVVSARGGRVVKLIGDEVMFVAEDLGTAVDIGLDLVERASGSTPRVELHCGVAHGPTITVGGDVFGPTVNLASRLTGIARRGTVIVPRDCVDELDGRPDLVVRRVRRTVDLKGIGRTRMVTVSRQAPTDETADGAGDGTADSMPPSDG
jgi:adenylate cyclase